MQDFMHKNVLQVINVRATGVIPERDCLDLVEFNLPLQNLFDLAFLWALLNLLASNQIQEFGGQDKVTLH